MPRLTPLALFLAALCLAASAVQAQEVPATQPAATQRVVTDPAEIAKVELATAKGGPAKGKRDPRLEPVALFYGPLPTVFAFSQEDRLFVAFPRWTRAANMTVAEVKDGKLVAFPDMATNRFLPERLGEYDPKTHLVSVQSVVVDEKNRLWLLDTGSINLGPPIEGGPKLWGYDLKTGERVKAIEFKPYKAEYGSGVIKPRTYLNDVRFDLSKGDEGIAYITDSGEGGIIVIDLASGTANRNMDGSDAVTADDIELKVEGEPMKQGGETPRIHSDGIAVISDGETLAVTPLTSRKLYVFQAQDVRLNWFHRAGLTSAPRIPSAEVIIEKPSANDGIWYDVETESILTTDFEDNALRRVDPESGKIELVTQDERLLWPDCVVVHKGDIYVTSNQLHRQPQFHGGKDMIEEPFVLFRLRGEED